MALCGMGQLIAQTTARLALRVWDTVDVCGRRECILIVEISPVQLTDSLMGFNLAIQYNPEKFAFHTMLVSGTLAEGMEQRAFSALYGEIRAYAFTLTRRISGAKPLVAFLGDYRRECPDTAVIQLKYVEFNEEFERRRVVQVDTTPVIVYARIVDTPDRTLWTQSLTRECNLVGTDTSCSWVVQVGYPPALELRSVATVITGLPSWLQVENIAVGEGVELQTWERSGDTLSIKWTSQRERSELIVELSARTQWADTVTLRLLSYPLDPCACLTRWIGDSLVVMAAPSQPSAVSERCQRVMVYPSGLLYLEPGERLELYDVLGRLLRSVHAEGKPFEVSLQGLPTGIYVGRWQRIGGAQLPVAFIVE